MNRSKDDYLPFSNAYDIAQEAMLFLCQHIGEKLGDNCTTKYGKVVTIKSACYRCADNYLQKQYTRYMANTISLDERITAEPKTILDEEQKNDYTAVDGLIAKMNLTAAEYETLCAYMAGLTYLEVTRLLNVTRTTIWRRRMSLQKKYALATNSLKEITDFENCSHICPLFKRQANRTIYRRATSRLSGLCQTQRYFNC